MVFATEILCHLYVPAVRRKMIFQAGELSCCSNVYGLFVEHLLRAIMGIRSAARDEN